MSGKNFIPIQMNILLSNLYRKNSTFINLILALYLMNYRFNVWQRIKQQQKKKIKFKKKWRLKPELNEYGNDSVKVMVLQLIIL